MFLMTWPPPPCPRAYLFLMCRTTSPSAGSAAFHSISGPASGWLNLALALTEMRRRVKSEAAAKKPSMAGRRKPGGAGEGRRGRIKGGGAAGGEGAKVGRGQARKG